MTSPNGPPGDAVAPLDEGLAAFAARDLEAAHAAFQRAHRRDTRGPRAMSWYGVTLVLVERNSNLGVSLCDQALRLAPYDPELLLNLARVHLALGQRERAVRAVLRGLEAQPDHAALRDARDALGTRRAPVIGVLARGNPLNRLLGKLRHRWARRHTPHYELSPEALGSPPGAAPAPRS
ncbi:MAG TPA: tetratricopeptide repeat protein [Anaeromyxobacteraceae bacterium]|nr:tetratricopeptide repeat protein [Anaeromyxobacteraceae bacterium]